MTAVAPVAVGGFRAPMARRRSIPDWVEGTGSASRQGALPPPLPALNTTITVPCDDDVDMPDAGEAKADLPADMPNVVPCRLVLEMGKEVVACGAGQDSYMIVKELPENHYGRTAVATVLEMRADGLSYPSSKTVCLKFVAKDRLAEKAAKVAAAQMRLIESGQRVPVCFENAQLEMQFLHKLASVEHIINLQHVLFSAKDRYFILVLDYAGADLFDWVCKLKANLPLPKALDLFSQMMKGLNGMHARGLAHRDISAENLLIAEGSHITVIDLGGACRFEWGARAARDVVMPVGVPKKPGWAPPEAYFKGTKYQPDRYDVWSCGQLLVFLVSGALACGLSVRGDPCFDYICQHGAGVLVGQRRDDLPTSLLQLVDDMLKPNFRKRPSAADVLQRVEKIRRSLPVA